MAVTFLHIADTHVGVETYGRLDPATGLNTRVADFTCCLDFAFDAAIERDVDFVVFAGDAYKTCDPSATHQRELARSIRRLSDAGIPIVIVVGNHDAPVAFGKANSVDIFRILGTDDIHIAATDCVIDLETKSGPVQVACLPWLHRSHLLATDDHKDLTEAEVLEHLQKLGANLVNGLAARVDRHKPVVLAAHLAVADALLSGSEQTAVIGRDPVFLTSTLAQSAFDYVALGHIHRHQNMNPEACPPVVYSGSIDRIDFGEEQETKGCCLVTVDHDESGDKRASYEFVATPSRPFRTIRVDVTHAVDPTQTIVSEIDKYDIADHIVRVIYRSDTPVQLDYHRIREATRSAALVAGIYPDTERIVKQRRTQVTRDMGLSTVLTAYIDNNAKLGPIREDLLKRAQELEAEAAGL
ncbi:TPA: exonuclease SbcCD subunit D [Candidatus Latescibacteria bacterium]|nr:exonuclease SbcCD subunit D [Candidatus Latescibacterota bacterium]